MLRSIVMGAAAMLLATAVTHAQTNSTETPAAPSATDQTDTHFRAHSDMTAPRTGRMPGTASERIDASDLEIVEPNPSATSATTGGGVYEPEEGLPRSD